MLQKFLQQIISLNRVYAFYMSCCKRGRDYNLSCKGLSLRGKNHIFVIAVNYHCWCDNDHQHWSCYALKPDSCISVNLIYCWMPF